MDCQLVNPLAEPRWNEWIAEFPAADTFHSAQWAQVLFESYGYSLHYVVLREGKQILAILPIAEVRSFLTGTRGVSLPFSDTCLPLVSDGASISDKLSEFLRDFGKRRGWRFLEVRGGNGSEVTGGVPTEQFFVHDLALELSEAAQFAKLKDSNRRNIRKARASGIEVKTFRDRQSMQTYYELHCLTRKRHGLPPQPFRFFDRIQKVLLESGAGFVQLAGHRGQWIAGAVFLQFRSRSTYKFGASNLAFQHLRPNNLLMWETIEKLRADGSGSLCFGRTDLDDDGLLQFKRSWGAVESRVSYWRLLMGGRSAVQVVGGRRGSAARFVLQRLPIPLLRLIGTLAYRHAG